jgi:hypothetical protein
MSLKKSYFECQQGSPKNHAAFFARSSRRDNSNARTLSRNVFLFAAKYFSDILKSLPSLISNVIGKIA